MPYQFDKLFDPHALATRAQKAHSAQHPFVAEYEYDDQIVLAVNVALATGRPLLLRGEPGSGKSTLAEDVARLLQLRYFEMVISSKSEASDLLWRIDQVGRISDAQTGQLKAQPENYIDPGVLWWALDPAQARRRGMRKAPLIPPGKSEQSRWNLADPDHTPAVVLIDEIDKAEPDFPNDLLVPLGALAFNVRAMGVDIAVKAAADMRPLVMITTNDERDLPQAFVRRCIVLDLTAPSPERLRKIARRHLTPEQLDDDVLCLLLEQFERLRGQAKTLRLRAPSTAEFLDAARALYKLDAGSGTPAKEHIVQISNLSLWKHNSPLDTMKAVA